MSDCRLRISILLLLQCVRLLLPESEQSGELYPNEGGWMASLTHSRKVYGRLGPWPFVRGPILNERITRGHVRRLHLQDALPVALCPFHLQEAPRRIAPALFPNRVPASVLPSSAPLFLERSLPLHSPPAPLHTPGANSSSRRRDARPSQPVDSTLRVEVGRALSGSLSCACSRF